MNLQELENGKPNLYVVALVKLKKAKDNAIY